MACAGHDPFKGVGDPSAAVAAQVVGAHPTPPRAWCSACDPACDGRCAQLILGKRALLGDEFALGVLDSTQRPSRIVLTLALAIALLPAAAILLYRYVASRAHWMPAPSPTRAGTDPYGQKASNRQLQWPASSSTIDDGRRWACSVARTRRWKQFLLRAATPSVTLTPRRDADVAVEMPEAQVLAERTIAGEPRKRPDQAVQSAGCGCPASPSRKMTTLQQQPTATPAGGTERFRRRKSCKSSAAAQRDGKPLPADDEEVQQQRERRRFRRRAPPVRTPAT